MDRIRSGFVAILVLLLAGFVASCSSFTPPSLPVLLDETPSPFNPIFHNNGDGTFTNIDHASGAADPGPSIGVAYADYDNDGWVDLVVGNYHRSYQLYHNERLAAGDNHWLTLKLVGGGPVNRDAIGAKAFVSTADSRTQVQEVRSGSAMGSGNALALYFGLGQATGGEVEILWPDGTKQAVGFVDADRVYEIRYEDSVSEKTYMRG